MSISPPLKDGDNGTPSCTQQGDSIGLGTHPVTTATPLLDGGTLSAGTLSCAQPGSIGLGTHPVTTDRTGAESGQDPGYIGVNPADRTAADYGQDSGYVGVNPADRTAAAEYGQDPGCTGTKKSAISRIKPIGIEIRWTLSSKSPRI